jgi:hypothetical protein
MNRTRIQRPRITSAHVIAVVALVLAMAGSATAAALITSKQIQDDTILSRDVKNKTLLVADIKPEERVKLRGPGPFAPPPSGSLVVGAGVVQGYVPNVSGQLTGFASLGFTPKKPLDDDIGVRNIWFGPSVDASDAYENATACPGSADEPSASPGVTCVYVVSSGNVEADSTEVFAGVSTVPADGGEPYGFIVAPDAQAISQLVFRYVWAYRAP